jgi:hypothetical protein
MPPKPKPQADVLLSAISDVLSPEQIFTLADILRRAKSEGSNGRLMIDLDNGEPCKIHLVQISSENFRAEVRESG